MENFDNETFGERFSRLVDAVGLSAHDVCAMVGWKSDSSYYKARRGDLMSMNPKGLLRLARRLGVSPYYLVNEPDPKPRRDKNDTASAVPEPQGDHLLSATLEENTVDVYVRPSGKPASKLKMATVGARVRAALEEINAHIIYVDEQPIAAAAGASSLPDDASKSTSFRLRSLEEAVDDLVDVAELVDRLDAGLDVLLAAAELPESLRDRLRAALAPAQSGRS